MKNKKANAPQEKPAESNGKRKAEDDEKAKESKKSKKDKSSKWEDADLPVDNKSKQIELALKEALKSNKVG